MPDQITAKNIRVHSVLKGSRRIAVPKELGIKASPILASHVPLDLKGFPNPPGKGSQRLTLTIANLLHLLKGYDIVVRYNTLKKISEVIVPGHTGLQDNLDATLLAYIHNLVLLHGMNTMHVSEFLNALADAHPYNPVASWICSKPWDGKDRLPEICATLKVEDGYPDDLKNLLVEKWLLSAVAAVFSTEEFSARGVLTLQGPQSLGKTSWIRSLANDPKLAADLILTGHHLDPGNKDSVMSAIAHWIVEIGELDSSFKKDVAMLKGFLSNPSDRFRRPYGKLDNVYRRRTVFAATVNDYNFLIDATGNTRFWTLPVVKINYNHKIEMQQVFAQLKIRFEEDHQWWLTNAEEALLESMNKQHRSISSMRELLEDAIDHDLIGTDGLPAYSATTLLVKLGMDRPTNPQARECAASLRELIGESKRINGSTTWRVPLKDEGKFPGL